MYGSDAGGKVSGEEQQQPIEFVWGGGMDPEGIWICHGKEVWVVES